MAKTTKILDIVLKIIAKVLVNDQMHTFKEIFIALQNVLKDWTRSFTLILFLFIYSLESVFEVVHNKRFRKRQKLQRF